MINLCQLFGIARERENANFNGMLVFPDGSTAEPSARRGDFEVEIDRQSNTMKIKTTHVSGFLEWTTDVIKWNMSGWTSRYGKPVELSLVLHLSTMAPDLVYDFCMHENLQTKVNIGMKKIIYEINFEYETINNSIVSKNDIQTVTENFKNSLPLVNIDQDLFKEDVFLGEVWGCYDFSSKAHLDSVEYNYSEAQALSEPGESRVITSNFNYDLNFFTNRRLFVEQRSRRSGRR